MKTRLPWLALLLCFPIAKAAEPPDYIRYADDSYSSRLELAIKTFSMPSGQKVDLIGVVHIADDSYYQALNRRFDAYDSVLFELVGDPGDLLESAPVPLDEREFQAGSGPVGFIQQAAGEYLGLTFQLGAIDYTKKNMVHADVSEAEFRTMQRERGENMLTMFTRAMQAQTTGPAHGAAMRQFNTFALIRILMSPDSALEFKKALAKMFDQSESMTAEMEGKDGTAVLSGRNDVAVRKLEQVLMQPRQRRVAVFYGGAHMPGIEASLLKSGGRLVGEEWLAAWTMPKAPPSGSQRL